MSHAVNLHSNDPVHFITVSLELWFSTSRMKIKFLLNLMLKYRALFQLSTRKAQGEDTGQCGCQFIVRGAHRSRLSRQGRCCNFATSSTNWLCIPFNETTLAKAGVGWRKSIALGSIFYLLGCVEETLSFIKHILSFHWWILLPLLHLFIDKFKHATCEKLLHVQCNKTSKGIFLMLELHLRCTYRYSDQRL